MQDGELTMLRLIQGFFDEPTIQRRIQQKQEEESQAKPHLSPYLKPVNPYAPKE